MESEKTALLAALDQAATLDRDHNPHRTLLGPGPRQSVLDILIKAIEASPSYQEVAGKVLFSANAGDVITANTLAMKIFDRGPQSRGNNEEAIDWLLKVLKTEKTTVLFKAAIWGLRINDAIQLDRQAQLIPFSELPRSWMSGRIIDKAKPCWDGSAWLDPRYFDTPTAAYIQEIPNFPYISAEDSAFEIIREVEKNSRELWVLIQAAVAVNPLAIACWAEYAESDLDISTIDNQFSWVLPEVHPRVSRISNADQNAIVSTISAYHSADNGWRSDLLRAMERFRLSQNRRDATDQILDLALAFEIAVSDDGPSGPVSWKVSVRTAQLLGGKLADRMLIRKSVSELYNMRNKAAHGSALKGIPVDQILKECTLHFNSLIKKLLVYKSKPEWKLIEMEPPAAP